MINKVTDEKTFKEVIKYPINRVQGNYIYPVIENKDILNFISEYVKKSKTKKTTSK